MLTQIPAFVAQTFSQDHPDWQAPARSSLMCWRHWHHHHCDPDYRRAADDTDFIRYLKLKSM